MTIYVDVLFITNFFITYILLRITALVLKNKIKVARLIIASVIGGLYSLIIFVPNMNMLASIISKLAVSFLLVLIAFTCSRLADFIKHVIMFYFSNMVLLGIMIATIFAFKSNSVLMKNNVVYFDISAINLMISAAVAYLSSCLITFIYNRSLSHKEIFTISVVKDNDEYRMFAFVDSGNKLKEPFTNYPVVIVDKSKISAPCDRIIPFNSLGGEGMLQAFKPDRIDIFNDKFNISTNKVYVALTDIDSSSYSAIISPDLLTI